MDLKTGRKEIDHIDKEILKLLKKRISIAKKLLPFKDKIYDKERENKILKGKGNFKEIFKKILLLTKKEMKTTAAKKKHVK